MNIFYNFLITLKRYTTSAVLNIIGLSLAFAAFIVLLIQFDFEHSYDSYNKNADRVYQMTLMAKSDASFKMACFSQPIIDKLSAESPHIVAATMFDDLSWSRNQCIKITRDNGAVEQFFMDFSQVYESFPEIADLEIIEGDPDVLKTPFKMLIPESAAKKLFPDESAVGKSFFGASDFLGIDCTIGAVYRDIPANSTFKNMFYYTRENDFKFGKNQYNFHFIIMIDSPDNLDEICAVMNKSLDQYFKDGGKEGEYHLGMTPLRDIYYTTDVQSDFNDKGNETKTNLMLAIAILIIIIATINYINFASSMAPLKIKMMNVQRIMGANIWRLRISILLESVMIALISFLLALLYVYMLSTTSFTDIWIADISIKANLVMVFYSGFIALMVGLIAGIYPAFYMTSFAPVLALKGSFAMSPRGKAYRAILIGCQYVISSILIISALFVALQNRFIGKYNLGYDKEQIAVVKSSPDLSKNRDAVISELRTNGEIEDVAYAFSKFGARDYYQNWGMEVNDEAWDFNIMPVSYNFLEVMGIPVSEGRDFRSEDQSSPDKLMIFNRVSPKQDGSQLALDDGDGEYKVIGFIDNSVHLQTLYVTENPFAFYFDKRYNDAIFLDAYLYIKIKEGVDKIQAVANIQKTLKKIDPTYQAEVEFLDAQLNELYKKDQRVGYLTTMASALAIIISLVGVFGLVLFETQFRRREIGVRRVLGATAEEILNLFNKKFIIITLVCFAIAVPLAIYAVNYWLSTFQYRIPIYWWVFAVSLLIILTITVLTVTLRSWKAANINPVKSIKTE